MRCSVPLMKSVATPLVTYQISLCLCVPTASCGAPGCCTDSCISRRIFPAASIPLPNCCDEWPSCPAFEALALTIPELHCFNSPGGFAFCPVASSGNREPNASSAGTFAANSRRSITNFIGRILRKHHISTRNQSVKSILYPSYPCRLCLCPKDFFAKNGQKTRVKPPHPLSSP